VSAAGVLAGRRAFVTEVTGAVERAVVESLLAEGASVRAHASGAAAMPDGVEVVPADLSERAQTLALAEQLGALDVLVCGLGEPSRDDAASLSAGGWSDALEGRLTAPFVLARAVGARMREAGGGVIVNLLPAIETASIAAASAATALLGLTRILAVEWAQTGVRVVAITVEDEANPRDVAEIVGFVASPSAAFVTGAHLRAAELATARRW
jgi:2-dehydro-3-deoxy-D-gluconate 5-dehydrogenase